MGDPWSKETGDKVMDRMEQGLSIEQVCEKYNAVLADNERLQARVEALEEVAQAVCDTKQVCQFETRLQKLAREALAATEQDNNTDTSEDVKVIRTVTEKYHDQVVADALKMIAEYQKELGTSYAKIEQLNDVLNEIFDMTNRGSIKWLINEALTEDKK